MRKIYKIMGGGFGYKKSSGENCKKSLDKCGESSIIQTINTTL